MPKPRGVSLRTLTYDGPFGSRNYKLYFPACAGLATSALSVVVMLHGCSQSPDDFATGTGMNALAEEHGFIVVYPAQDRRAHPNRCWNWYRFADQARGAGEPAILARLTSEVLHTTPADPARVYVAGLSAGASMAMVLGATYPDIFAAVGVHSGLPWGTARDAGTAVVAINSGAPGHRLPAPMPTIIFHGEADRVVNVRNARYIAIRASNAYTELRQAERTGHVPNGHSYVRQSHRRGKGRSFLESWLIKDAGHAWSGGSRSGRFADPSGPDASREILQFFLQHRTTIKHRKAMKAVGVV